MSTRLVILGLLRQRPLYGYELKQMIESHMADWTSIAFGSIYFALDKLAQEGFIEHAGTEQSGNRPSRIIYQITQSGRDEFLRLLRETWQNHERQYFSLDIAVFFMDALPRNEVEAYLRQQVDILVQVLTYIRDHQQEQMANIEMPALADAIFRHTILHTEAELAWTRELLQKVKTEAYP